MNDEDIESGTSCTGATPYKYLWNTVIVRTQTVDAVIVGRGTSMHAIPWLKNQSCSSMFRKLSEACSRCWVPVSTSFHGHFEWTAWGRARDARCARALVRLKTFGVRIRRFFSFFWAKATSSFRIPGEQSSITYYCMYSSNTWRTSTCLLGSRNLSKTMLVRANFIKFQSK
jgi:hypothetical protein